MESLSDESPVLTSGTSPVNLVSVLHPDDIVIFGYDKPPQALDGASNCNNKNPPSPYATAFLHTIDGPGLTQRVQRLWDHLRRFTTFYYSKHMSAPRRAPRYRVAQMVRPNAAQMVLFDDNSWLVTRLTPRPALLLDRPWLGLPLAATGLNKLNKIRSAYTDWRRRDAAGQAVVQQRGGKPLGRRVRLAPGNDDVSVFEGGSTEKTTITTDIFFVFMRIDCNGELTFYHDCLYCQDLSCSQCIEVLEDVAAFGRRHTLAIGHLKC